MDEPTRDGYYSPSHSTSRRSCLVQSTVPNVSHVSDVRRETKTVGFRDAFRTETGSRGYSTDYKRLEGRERQKIE